MGFGAAARRRQAGRFRSFPLASTRSADARDAALRVSGEYTTTKHATVNLSLRQIEKINQKPGEFVETSARKSKTIFTALKGDQVFDRAPRLEPTPYQVREAQEAVSRVRGRLPSSLERRLKERFSQEGHFINMAAYFPFPVLISDKDHVEQCRLWGRTYAGILSKIARRYSSPEGWSLRRYLQAALVRHLPSHLTDLLELYRTTDHLAGAHLGDDSLDGRSIEWNLGAVGGLDEGFQASLAVRRFLPKEKTALRPVEISPYETIRDALHHAYACHCGANGRKTRPRPLIAVVEHDDIYGSTVSIAEQLSLLGEKIHFCFDRELTFQDGHLRTAGGLVVDILSLDCHLEELEPDHAVLLALARNRVALDGSPLARLVLRSKVIVALLSTEKFRELAGLGDQERAMIDRHLMPTFLWRRRTFRTPPLKSAAALTSLLRHPRLAVAQKSTAGFHEEAKNTGPLAVKVGIGPVYGASSVAVVEREDGTFRTNDAARLVQGVFRDLAARSRPLPHSHIYGPLQAPLKGWAKEIFLRALSGTLSGEGGVSPFRREAETWWLELCRIALRQGGFSAKDWDIHSKNLSRIVESHFGTNPPGPGYRASSTWKDLGRFSLKLLRQCRASKGRAETARPFFLRLSHTVSSVRFPSHADLFGQMIRTIRRCVVQGEKITLVDLSERISTAVDGFLLGHFALRLPEAERARLDALLLPPFLEAQARAVNPVVIQPYRPPPSLEGESGLHVINRIHVIMGPHGPRTFIAGTQVFFLEHGLPINRYKMTASLWAEEGCERPPG